MIRTLIIISFIAVQLQAQSGIISGFVSDSTNQETLSFANVFIAGSDRGAASNRDGYYVISDLPLDTMTVVVSIIGYQFATRLIDLSQQSQQRIDFSLNPQVLEGEEIVVTAERQRFERAVRVSTVNLGPRDFKQTPAFIEADVFRTIQLLPGVQSVSDYSSALYVRGSTPDQNLILLDGITIYNPYHLGGIFSTFNTDAIKEAEFIAGGFGAEYGGRMGSVLDIVNRDGNGNEFQGNANISLISSKILLEGPLPKVGPVTGTYMFAGRRTYFDKIFDLILKGVEARYPDAETIGFPYYFYDYNLKATLNVGTKHRLTVSSFKGRDILEIADDQQSFYVREGYDFEGNSYEPQNVDSRSSFLLDWSWGNSANSITWRWIVSPKIITKLYFAKSDFDYTIEVSDFREEIVTRADTVVNHMIERFGFIAQDKIADQTIRGELTYFPTDNHKLTIGGERKELQFRLIWLFYGEFQSEGESESIQDTSVWIENKPVEQSVFIQDLWRITPQLILKAGARLSNYSLHQKAWNVEPRLSFKWLVRRNFAFTAAWGQYYQYLTTANPSDENFRIIDLWLPAPLDQAPPQSEHRIVGLEYFSDSEILFKIEAYQKTFDNLVYLDQGYMFFLGPEANQDALSDLNNFRSAEGKSHGLEILVKKPGGKVKGWLGYTYSKTVWKTEEFDWYAPKYDRTHTLNIVADWKMNEKWHFSTAYSLSSGNPYTPILGRVARTWGAPDPDRPYQQWWDTGFLTGAKNSSRYPFYARSDISLVKKTKTKRGWDKEFYIQVLNVFNRANVFQYLYSEAYNDRGENEGIQRITLPMFPIIPTFGVRYEF